MADDLAIKWLEHHDPIHDGWTDLGIVTGACAFCGQLFPLLAGGYLLRRGVQASGGRILNPVVVGVAEEDAVEIRQAAWVEQTPDEVYYYQCVPVGPGGVEAVIPTKDPGIVKVRIDADGEAPSPVPPAPRALRVAPIAGGVLRLAWEWWPSTQYMPAATFRVYHDGGTGTMNYGAPIMAVTVRRSVGGGGHYVVETDAFAHGTTVQIAVRARSAAGQEEANPVIVSAVADAQGPAAHQVADCTYGADE